VLVRVNKLLLQIK